MSSPLCLVGFVFNDHFDFFCFRSFSSLSLLNFGFDFLFFDLCLFLLLLFQLHPDHVDEERLRGNLRQGSGAQQLFVGQLRLFDAGHNDA